MKQVGENLSITRGCGLDQAVEDFEKWFIWWTLERNDFNQSKAADELKTHRNNLVRRIRDWGWADKIQQGYQENKDL